MTTSVKNSFLENIQRTEEKARVIINKGKEAIAKDLQAYQSEVSAAETEAVSGLRAGMQSKVESAQGDARKTYETILEEGQKQVKQITGSAESNIAAQVAGAQDYILNTLLG